MELSIHSEKSSVNITSCISNLIKDEILSGDNKYHCDNCGLVEAVRRLKLIKLPPVLNFQLLRFVYDPAKGSKKKLSTSVKFPRVLDMSEFVTKEYV